ncbi:major capsid protein, partial [Pseudomonas mediterranea]|uniref:major capsid protein n=1 Tax=Pseudomonas mediterranea TaxID=183795 RepID=UPI001F4C8A45
LDVSGSKKLDYISVNDSHALFGDSSSQLIAQVMDGAQFHGFIGQNLANAERLFLAGSVQVVDILGRLIVVTDAPALYSAATTTPAAPAKRRVLSLTQGAATVHDARDLISNIDTSNGKDRIETTLQIDY